MRSRRSTHQTRRRPGRIRVAGRPGTQQRTKLGRRPVELRVALIGMVAVLAGAVVGGVVAGTYSVATVERQIDGEQAKSLSEFSRSQRQIAYAQFITAEESLSRAEREAVIERRPPSATVLDAIGEAASLARAADNAMLDFDKAYANLLLVQSQEAEPYSREVALSHGIINALITGKLTVSGGLGPGMAEEGLKKAEEYMQHFLRQARFDLGTGPRPNPDLEQPEMLSSPERTALDDVVERVRRYGG